MPTYFPFLRGKQNELIALRELSHRIAASGSICPIIEPINANSTTRISFDNYVAADMPFLLVANPRNGDFKDRHQELCEEFTAKGALAEYDNYIPTFYIYRDTMMREVEQFERNYPSTAFRAVIYANEPMDPEVVNWCATDSRIYHHVVMDGAVPTTFVTGIPLPRRVILRDHFKRQLRNADYPPTEFFTDFNTPEGNTQGVNWGDYSIVGDNYSDSGGPAYAVAAHHIHFSPNGSALNVSHFISDRQETTADTPGKTLEAVRNLVNNLDDMAPDNTSACAEYRRMVATGNVRGLGYLKRLGILHHLEVLLGDE